MTFPKRLALCLVAALSILGSATARAGDLTVVLTDQKGRPVEDAVVTINAPGAPPSPGTFEITQKDMVFVPHVLVVPVGSTVRFGNIDPVRHHVYSFSPARKFELKLFGKGQTRPVRFEKPGIVAIGCNIHDSMQAFVVVVRTRFAGKSAANGRVRLRNVPAGTREVEIWHPRLRAPGNRLVVKADATSDRSVPVKLKLRRPAPEMHEY